MEKIKIGINGFGRIGRCILRAVIKYFPDIEVVAINDPFLSVDYAKYMLCYDSVHGKFDADIEIDGDYLIINGNKIRFFAEYEPENIDWTSCKAQYICEATGKYTKFEDASRHIASGAKKVVITAPSKSENVPMYVFGVNHQAYDGSSDIVSNASCTTNCLAPLAKILNDEIGIDEGLMTTVHSTTATQLTVDGPSKKDWRGGRSASANIIPSTTGAAKAVGKVIPELKGKLTGMAFRVPTINVSVVDLTFRPSRPTSLDEINKIIENASKTYMKGVVEYCDQPVVSSDFVGDSNTCIYDSLAGIELNDKFFKLIAWYDNEWGYSMKTLELIRAMFKVDSKKKEK